MGSSRTVEQFAHKLAGAAEAVEKARVKALTQIGREAEAIARAAAAGQLAGKDHFSGWPKAPLGVKSTVTPSTVTVAPSKRGKGPWRVLNDGRHPKQGPRITSGGKSGVRKVSRARVKRYNGETKGKGTWDEATTTIAEKAPKKIRSNVEAGLREVFQ